MKRNLLVSLFVLIACLLEAFAGCTPTYSSNGDDTLIAKCGVVSNQTTTKISHWAVTFPGQVGWYSFNPTGYGVCCTSADPTQPYSFAAWAVFNTPEVFSSYVQQRVDHVKANCSSTELSVCSYNCNATVFDWEQPWQQYDTNGYCATGSSGGPCDGF